MGNKIKIIAFYLPQFHPIPENDKWWGKGFTEWTNVGKAKPLFRGHYQPRVPADLGYYDLRIPEVRESQANMAKSFGINGFCYWHYWFGNGKRLLERPFNEVLQSGKPDFPFCLAWANQSWQGISHGIPNKKVLIEQLYPGKDDYINHFNSLLSAFKDSRYIRINDKPVFVIYKPLDIPKIQEFILLWNNLALQNGLKGIFFIAQHQSRQIFNNAPENETLEYLINNGFEAVNFVRTSDLGEKRGIFLRAIHKFSREILGKPMIFSYKEASEYFSQSIDFSMNAIPSIVPGWDHTPRSGKYGVVFSKTTPELFKQHVEKIFLSVIGKPSPQRLIFIKSWNEWAEGNYMEPDLKWGLQFLEVLKAQKDKFENPLIENDDIMDKAE
jgi:hypothetical protein